MRSTLSHNYEYEKKLIQIQIASQTVAIKRTFGHSNTRWARSGAIVMAGNWSKKHMLVKNGVLNKKKSVMVHAFFGSNRCQWEAFPLQTNIVPEDACLKLSLMK